MTFNWHNKHVSEQTTGDHIADLVASGMGSWRFIIIQTIFVIVWMVLNVVGFAAHWDTYPFILLNLLFSTQAAYAAPIIMMAQNRQADRDRIQAESDYETNREAERRIELLQQQLSDLEVSSTERRIEELQSKLEIVERERKEKIDIIMELLQKQNG
jgi:uncharacterized membrane protein